ncbi:MAG: trehalose-binding protein [Pseudodesulfovibrio sp.]|uniref:Formylmethanofuran dehydrogenase subunit E region n=1 Tax=Pseudodesulfovibrio aespoeensis (strain ATCC 700646 / DSM 10631 / Aspo-2) TaxID=643562 RepID=E6VWY5_PSEA9|nr:MULTISPECIES: FmdE family protein [Pseudodesulfovibrio]MBU4192546.1 trehalose-binding protein [Pseudomonadota bacterium]ADU61391.1 formylmethanofuran dehydrogenase subunit E region [Pseudodesulfovibrio aespoeensis Aspo-2]MBU4244791.1 trehalose-binding protein [Pseudomonadota bacterium]MBU4378979.1 trehalose-binding protein [Pseudomonadota bacterium]MBU4474784.1 trehalose-binding protein [Pseudomonadota bacterium]
MNIGQYTFEEFKQRAKDFHGYPAPGLLIGGYMVEAAKGRLPKGTLFEAMVESGKCLPDAVQLLTVCSIGNNWMKIKLLGRYAVSLYDKYTGQGFRVAIDQDKLEAWPEIKGWFMKLTPKAEQDTDKLFAEIEAAGDTICSVRPITIDKKYLGHGHMSAIDVCPVCAEAYPTSDGPICRGCQGEAPYVTTDDASCLDDAPLLRAVPVEQAVGKKALHDMTGIVPGESKGPVTSAGDTLEAGDVCRLQRIGKHNVFVQEDLPGDEWVHENDAVKAFAKRMAGPGISYDPDPREGKINFFAEHAGLLSIDLDALDRFNLSPDVMLATRHDGSLMPQGKGVAGTRAIPLYIARDKFSRALAALGDSPVFEILPLRRAKVGILVTGTEVFKGLIDDKFIPIISAKVINLGCEVTKTDIVPDDRETITASARAMLDAGCDLIVTTAGMSVDPDDVTRTALVDAGLRDALYGVPMLPGTMTLVGRLGSAQIIGVPACALFYKTTSLDVILPRLLAGQTLTRRMLARLGEGGFCMNCKTCSFPKCPFGK